MRIVESPHDDLLWTSRYERIGDIGEERRIPPAVVGDAGAIDPYRRLEIHGAEVEQQPTARSPGASKVRRYQQAR